MWASYKVCVFLRAYPSLHACCDDHVCVSEPHRVKEASSVDGVSSVRAGRTRGRQGEQYGRQLSEVCGVHSFLQMDAEKQVSEEAKECLLFIIMFIVLYDTDNAIMTERLEYVMKIMDPTNNYTLVRWLQSYVMPRYEHIPTFIQHSTLTLPLHNTQDIHF